MATTTAKTSIYVWKGTDRQGRPTQGESSGISQTVIKAQLRKQGIVPKTVKKKPKPLFASKQAIKPMDIAIFNAVPGLVWFALKVFLLLFCFIWIRATLPRYRYDQLMRLGWKIFLPISLLWVVIVASVKMFF